MILEVILVFFFSLAFGFCLFLAYVIVCNVLHIDFNERRLLHSLAIMSVIAIAISYYDIVIIGNAPKVIYARPIYSLDLNYGVSGDFVLGIGEIRSSVTFCYFVKENNLYKIECHDGKKVFLTRSNDNISKVKLVKIGYLLSHNFHYILALGKNCRLKRFNFLKGD